jgi:hypothetical protein
MADNQQTDFNYDEMNSWATDLSVDDYNQQPEFVLPDPDVYTVELIKKHPTTKVKPEFNKSTRTSIRPDSTSRLSMTRTLTRPFPCG